MKSLVALAAVAAVAAIAAPASAQSMLAPMTFNAGLGYTGFSLPRTDLSAVTLRAGADFGRYLGVEAEGAFGVDQAETVVGTFSTKTHLNDEYAAYGVARLPITPSVGLFARAGYGHLDIKVSGTDLASNASASATGGVDSINYGGGGQWFLDGKNGVRVEYTRYDFRSSGSRGADSFSISYVHKF